MHIFHVNIHVIPSLCISITPLCFPHTMYHFQLQMWFHVNFSYRPCLIGFCHIYWTLPILCITLLLRWGFMWLLLHWFLPQLLTPSIHWIVFVSFCVNFLLIFLQKFFATCTSAFVYSCHILNSLTLFWCFVWLSPSVKWQFALFVVGHFNFAALYGCPRGSFM